MRQPSTNPRDRRLQVPLTARELAAVQHLAQTLGMSAAGLARYAMLRLAEDRQRALERQA